MKIAYVMSRFPLLSETFILREMDEVESQGGEIVLYPLICQEPDVIHESAQKWIPRRNCIPLLSLGTLREAVGVFLRKPLKVVRLLTEVIFWNLPSPKFLLRALSLFPKSLVTAAKMKEEGLDHIHVHYASHPALMAYIISRLEGITYSITIHSHDIYDNHVMLKQKLSRANFLITISEYNVEYLANLLGEQVREKLHVVHCGVDPDKYQPLPPRLRSARKHIEILQVGSLHWKKGQTYFLEGVRLIADKVPQLHVRIIGDGPERPKIEARIRELGLEKIVTLMGSLTQTEVRKILPTADIYVQSSVSEGIPVALMEALSCEIPVVSTKITGIPELIRHEETGLLIPPRDPQAISDAVIRLIDDPAQAHQYAKAGRRLVVEKFNLAANVSALNRIFQSHLLTS